MALTKAQLSLVSVSTLGVAPGGYAAQLAAFNSQKEAAAFIQAEGLLNGGTNAEFVNTVAGNLNNLATASQKAAFLKAIDDGASRSDATVDFANTLLVSNGSIANVTKAIASTSTSMDLNALKAEITPVDSAQIVTFNTASGTGFAQKDLQANLGKAEIENGASKISANFTFNLKNQANVFTDLAGPVSTGGAPGSTVGEFTGAFLSPMLERAPQTQSDSAIFVRLLDGFATRDNVQSIERLATNGIGFQVDGVSIVVADKATDVDAEGKSTGAIYKAKNYVELKDALTARIAELAATGEGAYAKLATFTVELGSSFTRTNQAGEQVTGTEIIIKDSEGAVLKPEGFNTFGGIHPFTDLNSINELSNKAPEKSTQLISTNINAENVGYGSQGATLNIAGQSASKKGVEEFKVTATKDVWFTRLESRDLQSNQHLQEVLLQTGSNGYFRVGTQDKGASLVALVDEDFSSSSNKGAGLVDVLKLDAAAANSTAINAFISDDVIARNYKLSETDEDYKTDDVKIQYNLTSGNDVLQLAVASEVLAYADTQVNIVAGAGDDLVHLKVVGNDVDATTGKVANAGAAGTYGKGWLANQQLNDNVKINAAAGNNTIWTEGSGNVRITTGGGNDTVYADNSGRTTLQDTGAVAKLKALGMGADVNALYVLNARSANIGDILSNTANATDGVTNVAQEFKTFKNTVSVKFKGFESKYVEIASTNYVTNTQQINQAIKEAINKDATLNKLIVAKEFPGNVLVIESLIDGLLTIGELDISIIPPVTYNATETPAAKTAREEAGQLMLNKDEEAKADKAYGVAVPTTTVTDMATAATAAETLYDTEFATSSTGANPFAIAPAVAESAPFDAGVAGTLTFDLTGAATFTKGSGNVDVGGHTVAVLAADTANDIAGKIYAVLNGLAATDTVTFAGLGAIPVSQLTFTDPAAGDNLVIGVSAAWILDNSATLAASRIPVINDNAATGFSIVQPDVTAVAPTAATAEEQTLTFVDAVNAGTVTVAGYDVAITAGMTKEAIATAVHTAINGNNDENGVVLTSTDNSDGTLTIEYPAVAGNVAPITVSQAGVGVNHEGGNSWAESDNVIDLGTGQDVLVMGTGALSNDTVVLSGTFGKTTIVNFDDTTVAAEAVNGGDLLDFRTYLEANYGAAGQANVSLVTAASTLAANTVTVIDFSTLQDSFTATGSTTVTGIKSTEALNNVTVSQLTAELNADFSAGTTAATKHVFLIHNDNTTAELDNLGEYLVVTANSAATDSKLAGVTIVGTLDFGEAQNFTGNIVGFDGHIA